MQDILFFINNNLLLCVAWFTVLLLLLAVEIRERVAGPKALSVLGLTTLINNEQAVLIDLRPESDFNIGHICQAISFALSNVNDNNVLYKKLESSKDKFIILVCKDGIQSKQQAFKLKNKGLEKIGYLNGGMLTWKSEGLPTVSV